VFGECVHWRITNNRATSRPKKLVREPGHDVSVLDQTGRIRVGSIDSIVDMPDETVNL